MNRPSSGSARRSSSAATSVAPAAASWPPPLVRYADTAARLGAAGVTFLGTEPIRRAADAAARRPARPPQTAGAPFHVLSHEEEAFLTIIGVTEGMPVTHETLVIDVGGGSSEFCIVDATRRPRAVGLQLGSARLTDRFVTHDPPTETEVAAMRAAARRRARAARRTASPAEIVAVGGTASNLVKMLPEAIADRILTRERIARSPGDPRDGAAPPVASARHGDQSRPGAAPAGRRRDRRRDPRALRRGSHPRLRGGPPRRRDPRRGPRRAVLARPPVRPRPRLAHLALARDPPDLQPGDDPPEGAPERDARPRRATVLPMRPPQPRDLALAADQVAPDRGALERRQLPGVLDQERPGHRGRRRRRRSSARGGPGAR